MTLACIIDVNTCAAELLLTRHGERDDCDEDDDNDAGDDDDDDDFDAEGVDDDSEETAEGEQE